MARTGIFGLTTRSLLLVGLTVATALSAAGTASAAMQSPTGFTVNLSSSPRVLDALDMKNDGVISSNTFYDIKYDEACDNPHLRIRARNKPALMITDAAGAPADLTSFTIKINEGPYVFGTGDVAGDNFTNFIKNTMYTDPGVSITGSSVSGDSKTLTVNFNGLAPGKIAVFNIDLDTPDPNMFMYPDYRMVLFGAPLEGGNPTTPATVTATYANNAAMPTVSLGQACDIYGNPLNYEETPDYANEDIRAYGDMDPIEVAALGVPEPTTGAMMLAGLAMLAIRSRRSR
jgi:hypothetical protein